MLFCKNSIARVRREDSSADGEKEARLFSLKGGSAAVQLILKPKKDCFFSADISPLTDEKGNPFPADCLTVYYEKYIAVDRNWQKNGYPAGDYPDALIPVSAPVLHGENHVRAGENGALFVELKAPAKQPAGCYRGVIRVSADEIYEIPLQIEIFRSELPEHAMPQSIFTVNAKHVAHFEEAATKTAYQKYCEALIRHGLSPSGAFAEEGENERFQYSDWADECAELVEKGATAFSIPEREEDGAFSVSELVAHFGALRKKSLETGLNLFEYAVFYDWMIDEPFCVKYPNGKVQKHIELFAFAVREAEKAFSEEPTGFERELLLSLKKVPHIITDYAERPSEAMFPLFDSEGLPYEYDLSRVTLCPKFDGYDTDEMVARYKAQEPKWWYGCNTPNAPFVGYHIDDAGESPELVGWLMAKYGIKGNLYWIVNYGMEFNTTGKPLWLDDAFSTAHRGFGANGDGVLLYPGKTYGLKEPIVCLRLKAIRDGNEDYAVLNAIVREYEKRGKDAGGMTERLFAPIADHTKFDAFGTRFGRAKETLYRLYEALTQFGLTLEISEEEKGFVFSFEADCGCKITADGKRTDGKIMIPRESRYAEFTVLSQEVEKKFSFWLGEGLKVILHETLFARNALSGDAEFSINRDEIRRRVSATPVHKDPHLFIDTGETLSAYETCAFLVRTKEQGVRYAVKNDGKTVAEGVLSYGWNRIGMQSRKFKGTRLELVLSGKVKIWLGEIYLFG